MNRAHDVRNVSFCADKMRLLVDGKPYEVEIAKHSAKLTVASQEQRLAFVLSPSGYGVRWPEIDEDLSIDALIGVSHTFPLFKSAR